MFHHLFAYCGTNYAALAFTFLAATYFAWSIRFASSRRFLAFLLGSGDLWCCSRASHALHSCFVSTGISVLVDDYMFRQSSMTTPGCAMIQ
jgi:hypothetical protein